MPNWANSDRRNRLPSDWDARRKKRFRIDDFRCTWENVYDERCTGPAEECDHHIPNDDHSIENLRSMCSFHHGQKSGKEGADARAANWRRNNSKFRRAEKHPGEL
ncbi:HNH endonuclease [Kribbella italica]|uniref:5-methylcytosine-specific restriction endonuclease McrA n=1 Tax=Kribbella italica TaxID=1540520 RepID=A0A7W9J1I4_9ACTN|nr:HNH endonuclease [Kribbella italica]MBB5833425.1 5-methylcytosine-specific restriction endonuclease McrA [Kribbella italica]